jgi:hypothetical protein
MIIRAGFGIAFELSQPTPMVLMLSVHPSRTKHILTDPRIVASPGLPMPWPTNQDDRSHVLRRTFKSLPLRASMFPELHPAGTSFARVGWLERALLLAAWL